MIYKSQKSTLLERHSLRALALKILSTLPDLLAG